MQRTSPDIEDYWRKKLSDEHPAEQVWKWLGYLFLLANNLSRAEELLAQSVAVSRTLDFTVHTIGLSALALQSLALRMDGDNAKADQVTRECEEWIGLLKAKSAPFAVYAASVMAGQTTLLEKSEECKAAAARIAAFPPFAYA